MRQGPAPIDAGGLDHAGRDRHEVLLDDASDREGRGETDDERAGGGADADADHDTRERAEPRP